MTLEEDFKKFEQSYKQYYGKNYDKALNNLRTTKKRLKDEFDRFSFNVVLSKTGDVTGTSVSFKIREEQFPDITTKTFKELYSGELYWKPRIWGTCGMVQPFVISTNTLSYNVRKFTIYVNAMSGFSSNFKALETSWKGTADDITKMAVDKDDSYFVSRVYYFTCRWHK